MTDEQYTRCPGCRTVFRVTEQQLAMRGGQVRCGHCRTVFDGIEHLVSLAPRPEPDDDFDDYDEAALGPATVTLRSAQALESPVEVQGEAATGAPEAGTDAVPPVASTAAPHAETEAFPPTAPTDADEIPADAGTIAEDAPVPADDGRAGGEPPPAAVPAAPVAVPAPTPAAPRTRRWGFARVAYLIGIPLLALLLMGQAAFHFREAIAARWPAFQPTRWAAASARRARSRIWRSRRQTSRRTPRTRGC